ncbi:uncharacterized protein LOC144098054 [Amblyomma americanum]
MATGVYEQDERGDYEPEDKSHREPARVPHNRSLIVAICVTTALTLCFLFYLWGTAPSAEALKETTTPSTERYYMGNGGASGTSGHATNKHTAHHINIRFPTPCDSRSGPPPTETVPGGSSSVDSTPPTIYQLQR